MPSATPFSCKLGFPLLLRMRIKSRCPNSFDLTRPTTLKWPPVHYTNGDHGRRRSRLYVNYYGSIWGPQVFTELSAPHGITL